MVKGLTFFHNLTVADKKWSRVSTRAAAVAHHRLVRKLCFVVAGSILVTASPGAPQVIETLSSDRETSVVSWIGGSNHVPAKLYGSLAHSHGRNEHWLIAHAAGRLRRIESSLSAPQPTRYSIRSASMPVEPNINLIPLPPDTPPVFTDDPLVAGVTVVQALHITELRLAVNQVRVVAGLPAASWDEAIAPGGQIKAAHILELRARLNDARTHLNLPAASYSDPPPSIDGGIRAAHVQELRDCIKEMLSTTTNADSTTARLDPINRTGGGGEDPLSRNFNWSVPLVGLQGIRT